MLLCIISSSVRLCVVHVKYCNHWLWIWLVWHVGECGVRVWKNDIGMGVRKVLWCHSFLPCLVAFWGFHPHVSFHFFILWFFCDLFQLLFFGGGGAGIYYSGDRLR